MRTFTIIVCALTLAITSLTDAHAKPKKKARAHNAPPASVIPDAPPQSDDPIVPRTTRTRPQPPAEPWVEPEQETVAKPRPAPAQSDSQEVAPSPSRVINGVPVRIEILFARRGVPPPLTLCLEVDGKRGELIVMVPDGEGDLRQEWEGTVPRGNLRILMRTSQLKDWEYEPTPDPETGGVELIFTRKKAIASR